MPKSSFQHDRDGIAIDALRTKFPKYWIYKDPTNLFGRKEYSEDLIIEIVNDDSKRTVTGVEFGVQNKTNPLLRKGYISVNLDIDDIERLLDLQRPVLIHAFHIETETSYWIWLKEWFATNHSKLKGRKKIAVKIPRSNILDERGVEKIRKYAIWEHLSKKAKESKGSEERKFFRNYNLYEVRGKTSIIAVSDPRQRTENITIEPFDDLASATMERAFGDDEAVPFIGKFVISNPPDFILNNIEVFLENSWLFHHLPRNNFIPLKIEYFDLTENVIFITPHLVLEIKHLDTNTSLWTGKDEENQVTYDISFDKQQSSTNYNITFNAVSTTISDLRNYYKLLDVVKTVKHLRITNLDTNEVIQQDFSMPVREYTLEEQVNRRMIYALSTINDQLHLHLEMPKNFTYELLERAEWIATVLLEGQVKVNAADIVPEGAALFLSDPASGVRKMLEGFESDGAIGVQLVTTSAEMKVELLEHTVELGTAHYAFGNLKLINVDEIREVLSNLELEDDASVTTVLDIDRDEVYLAFPNWMKEKE